MLILMRIVTRRFKLTYTSTSTSTDAARGVDHVVFLLEQCVCTVHTVLYAHMINQKGMKVEIKGEKKENGARGHGEHGGHGGEIDMMSSQGVLRK